MTDDTTSAADLIAELRATQERAADRYDALWHTKTLIGAELARVTSERDQAITDRDQALRSVDATQAARQAHDDATKAKLIKMRRYIIRHDLQIGECVAWNDLKAAFNIGYNTQDDDAWLANWTQATPPVELFPPPATESPAERIAERALRVVGRFKRLGEDGRP